jgi:hypothetical protein
MFKTIFESPPLPYRTPDERAGVPGGIGLGSLYNAELVTYPRRFSETIYSLDGMFSSVEGGVRVITIAAWTEMIYWPGWQRLFWKFNAETGAFIRSGGNPASYYDYEVFQAVDGSVWRRRITGTLVQIDPVTLEVIAGTTRDFSTDFGVIDVYAFIVDRTNNVIVMHANDDVGANTISVRNWTTGELIRRIPVSGKAISIMPEDSRRCYVVTSLGMLNLVNYVTGEVLTALRTPASISGLNETVYCYELATRRFLTFERVDDAEDGACLSTIKGYYPIPQPVALTIPVPITKPRRGETSRMLVRTIGDAGEGLNSGTIQVSVPEPLPGFASPIQTSGVTVNDLYGYSLFAVTGLNSGTATVELELNVP